jgi:hypothetical protein
LVGPAIEIQHCKINWKPPEKGRGEVKEIEPATFTMA